MFKFVLLTVLLGTLNVHAEDQTQSTEAQTKMKVEDAVQRKNSVSGDIDEDITNAKLRAESGSKSKFSMSIKGAYTGGSLDEPFGEKRPRLSADPGVQSFTSLDMGLSARYRWTKNDSVTLGTAFGFVTPFQGKVTTNDAINVNDPNIAYGRAGKMGSFQTVSSFAYAYGTSINSRDVNATHQLGLAYNAMTEVVGKLSAGASVGFGYTMYSSDAGTLAATHSSSYGHDSRIDYSLGIFPQAEYAFTDHFQARTVFGYFNWMHKYGDTKSARLLQTYVYQSIGIGWSVARDIYLYPNIQFVPDNIRSDFTNVALSATINVF